MHRTWWTRERVLAGLRRFHQEHGLAPTSTEEWHRLTGHRGARGGGSGTRRRYPSFSGVLRYFATFRQAWTAAGIDTGRAMESWSELEDWYLREGAGLIPRAELARDLQRTPDAVHRRLYDLGIHAYQRWGWTLHRVERVAQVPRHVLQTYLDRGDLPYLRGCKVVFVDPGDLVVVREIDWDNPPAELEEAARLEAPPWRALFFAARPALGAALGAAGIGHKAYYRVPTHRQPAMRGYARGVELPGTEEAARTHLAIPVSPVLSREQAAEVVAAVRDAGLGRPH
jgi:hypothetical protein